MTDEKGNILISARNGSSPDVECEADVDVTKFGDKNWTYVRIKVGYEHLGFDGWNKYKVGLYLCGLGRATERLELFDVYIYGKKGLELMTNFILVVKKMVEASKDILLVGGIDHFSVRMQALCIALNKSVRLFNSNYHRAVASKLGEEEVEIG